MSDPMYALKTAAADVVLSGKGALCCRRDRVGHSSSVSSP
jgi:hypothetical protein